MNEGTLFAVVCYWEENENQEMSFAGYEKLFRQKDEALRYSHFCNNSYEYFIFNVEPISYEVAKAGNILNLLEG